MRPTQIIVPIERVHQYGLGAWLIAYLNEIAPDQEGWIAVSDRQIHRDTGLPFRTIRRELNKLERAGILEIQREPRKTPRYRFTTRAQNTRSQRLTGVGNLWRTLLYDLLEG
jgi:DNA-binding transcriptional ArsR family regulator